MQIGIIGTGYVGLVSGACFAELGHNVICVDTNDAVVETLNSGAIHIHEDGLTELVQGNAAAGRLKFSTELSETVGNSDIVFIAVGTPSRPEDGYPDLTYVHKAATEIAVSLRGYTVVVTKSTVPVGTTRSIRQIIEEANPDADFDVAANPEFLREGDAIEDFMCPDRIVIGAESAEAIAALKEVYGRISALGVPLVVTDLETAELVKYASNAFLATKIAFINEMADLCECLGGNIESVAYAVGLDSRIGSKFLRAGAGFGGSCLPKDLRALSALGKMVQRESRIVNAAIEANTFRKQQMAQRIVHACGGSVSGKTLAILGVTFKPNTDDMREAPSIEILEALVRAGAHLQAYDPAGIVTALPLIKSVEWCASAYAAMEDADAVVILTEWEVFRFLDLDRMKKLLRASLIIDLRNIYQPEDVVAAGLAYVGIGQPPVGLEHARLHTEHFEQSDEPFPEVPRLVSSDAD